MDSPLSEEFIDDVLEKHVPKLMRIPGVVGVGRGESNGQPCIRVFVVARTPDVLSRIPPDIEGYEVSVQNSGELNAIDSG